MYRLLPIVALCFLTGCQSSATAVDTKVKTTTLAVKTVKVMQDIEIDRPIVITHAGDGSNRLFIASQMGKVYSLDKGADSEEPSLFLDIEDRVIYDDKKNEEGLLGLAFHPDYKSNGHVFIYYTTRAEPRLSIISRFTVSKDDPSKADPDSEHEIMRIKQPFWNHNGGTICFGPDGYMYIGLGDGGSARDPQGNGQNLKTLLGSILRIDIDKTDTDKTDTDKQYAIPDDNPFVDVKDARPEIYAYGLRNVWRMSFDRKTGRLFAADVGQDIWEEIDIIESGKNYGWNKREGMHSFGENGSGPADEYVEPIWEYHHDIGKSITGGNVYRGKKTPALDGVYIFADYITGYVWGVRYDEASGQVTSHHEIAGPHFVREKKNFAPIITFGEDEQGEVYFSDARGILYSFTSSK